MCVSQQKDSAAIWVAEQLASLCYPSIFISLLPKPSSTLVCSLQVNIYILYMYIYNICLLSSSYWCVLMGRPLLRCFSWDAFQMKQKKKKPQILYTVGVQYRLRSIYILSPRVLPSSTSHLSPPIEQESACVYACLCSTVTYVGHWCPTVRHAQSCSGGVLLMSGCI